MSVAVAPRVILRRNTPRAQGAFASSASVFPSSLLAGHINIDASCRHRQQLAIVDFLRGRADQVDQHLAAADHGHDVSRLDHAVSGGVDDLVTPSDALDKDPVLREERLGVRRRLADNPCALLDAVSAQLMLIPSRSRTAELLLTPVFLFVLPTGGFEVDAEQGGAEKGDDHRGTEGAENIGDGVGDRHRIEQALGFFGWEAQPVDRIGGQAHRRGNRLGAGIQPCSGTGVIAREPGGQVTADQAEHADDHGEQCLRDAVGGDAAHELRPHGVPDRKEEHQEKERLERPRGRNIKLADDHRGD